jgi:protein-tyrosine phosphatase
VIDLHSHVLPHLDDGAEDLPQSIAMCEALIERGVSTVVATPHVRYDYPTQVGEMTARLGELQKATAHLDIVVLGGGEIGLDQLGRPLDELRAFGLGGNPNALLIETPYLEWPRGLPHEVQRLREHGVRALLAHPERNPGVQRSVKRLEEAVAAGAFVQVTASSITGRFGQRVARTARALLEAGYVHVVASDTHGVDTRCLDLGGVAEAIGDSELARWLMHDVPRAILTGTEPPPRPPWRKGRRTFLTRLGIGNDPRR